MKVSEVDNSDEGSMSPSNSIGDIRIGLANGLEPTRTGSAGEID